MENQFILILGLVIMFNLFEQIYLFWKQRLRATLQKHYFIAKAAFVALDITPAWWNRIYATLQIYYFTLKSLVAALQRYIYNSVRPSEFLHRNFPTVMRHISKWIHVESESRMTTSEWSNGNSK